MSTEDLSKKHVTFGPATEDEEHLMKLDRLCATLKTDCYYGLTSKYASNLLKKDGKNKYSRPAGSDKGGLKKKEWSKRDWDRVFNGRANDNYVVLRDGQRTIIRRRELVRGDLVYLQTGQIVPADMRVISYDGELIVDNRVITGNHAELKTSSPTSHDFLMSQNMIFACTSIINGRCEALVMRTGDNTVFGELTQFATKVRYVKRQNSTSMSSMSSASSTSMGSLSLPSSLDLSTISSENLSGAPSTLSL